MVQIIGEQQSKNGGNRGLIERQTRRVKEGQLHSQDDLSGLMPILGCGGGVRCVMLKIWPRGLNAELTWPDAITRLIKAMPCFHYSNLCAFVHVDFRVYLVKARQAILNLYELPPTSQVLTSGEVRPINS